MSQGLKPDNICAVIVGVETPTCLRKVKGEVGRHTFNEIDLLNR
jgi:hypothetical protein